MEKTFYSNGKLLITGEYLVLDGAKALALPTKYGQYLTVEFLDRIRDEKKFSSLDELIAQLNSDKKMTEAY